MTAGNTMPLTSLTDKYLFNHVYDYRINLECAHHAFQDVFISVDGNVPDWKQTTFASGPPTPPSNAKRAKLRAKRKKRG
jgi:hypothetical protein